MPNNLRHILLFLFSTIQLLAQGELHYLKEKIDTTQLAQVINQTNFLTPKNPISTPTTNTTNEPIDSLIGITGNTIQQVKIDSLDVFSKSEKTQNEMLIQSLASSSEKQTLMPAEKRNANLVNEGTLLFYLFCIIGILYAISRINYTPFIRNLMRSFQSIRAARIQYEDLSYRDNFPRILLLANSVLTFSLLIYWFVAHYFNNNSNPMILWGSCFFIFLLIFVIRFLVLKILSFVFPFSQTINFYAFNNQIINIIGGVFLLPILMISLCVKEISINIIAGILISFLAFFLIFRIYRAYQVGESLIVKHPFYFFIYLCTSEISPILVLYKFFITN